MNEAVALPVWALEEMYPGYDAPELENDLREATDRATAFAAAYAGQVAALSGAAFGTAVAEFEVLEEILGRLMSYAQLQFSIHVSDPDTTRFYQTMQERVTDISSQVLFFRLEINRIDEAELTAKLADPVAARYVPWMRDLRVFRDHQLSDDLEKLLHEKSVSGASAWTRLFEETMAGLRFDVDGKSLTNSEVMTLMTDPDGAVRKSAAKAFALVLGDNIQLFSLITNTLAKDKETEDRWRGYARPVSARNLSNLVEDDVVDALVTSVQAAYPDLAHRYYGLKARWMGVDKLEYWDRNAPLPDADTAEIPWAEARSRVLDAYGAFSPDMRDIAQTFFTKGWIDAAPRQGKDSGAFAHPTVPSAHPYVLLNYHGKTRDVMTLAHELGHGVHQVLAAEQGLLLSDTPLTLAETASVFGEMLTFRGLLAAETDPVARRVLLAGKIEDMLNTVVRQVAFYNFERRVHEERRGGELSADRLGEIWLAVQRESLGPVFRFDDEYRHFWSYIPHFLHTPFYVYAYAFGDCLVNSLYDVFAQGHPGFQAKYLAMLRAGGTLRHKELLAPFGLDAGDPEFWRRGLSVVSGFIDQIEADF